MILVLFACSGSPDSAPSAVEPVPIGIAECDVCGMVVGEQPSPRGQLAYRDGTHTFTCSIDEARALASSPDRRGRPLAVWIEAVPRDFDWTGTDTTAQPWVAAAEAHFVYGADRRFVMGTPVLSYAERSAAERAAEKLGSTPVSWQDLLETPVPAVPPKAGWSPPQSRSER